MLNEYQMSRLFFDLGQGHSDFKVKTCFSHKQLGDYDIHVISPDFVGSSRFGAFSHGLTLGRRNLPTRGFPMLLVFFLSEHFIVYGNNLPGGKVADH